MWQKASSHLPHLAGRQLQFNEHPLREVLLGDSRQQSLWLLTGSAAKFEAKVMHTDQYFMPLFEIPLLQGRQFSAAKVQTQASLIIINQRLANKLKTGQDVIGQRLTAAHSGQVFEINGVSADQKLPEIGAEQEPFRIYTTQNLLYRSYLLMQLKPAAELNKTDINQLITQVARHLRSANI